MDTVIARKEGWRPAEINGGKRNCFASKERGSEGMGVRCSEMKGTWHPFLPVRQRARNKTQVLLITSDPIMGIAAGTSEKPTQISSKS